tara:strand:- start:122 stop:1171 length:1050 start_codon:yes stop_codon:yes gene_type:complete
MKIKNSRNKKNFLKSLFIKISRKLGYEIVDQSNLFVPTLNKSANQNLSVPNRSSISIPLGKVQITRKVKSLTIIIRSYTSTEVKKSKIMLDQNKSRIFEKPKIEYTLRTINSLIFSCKEALKNFKELKINLIVTDDNSNKKNLSLIENLLHNSKLNFEIININKSEFEGQIQNKDENGEDISEAMMSNMRNILKSIYLTKSKVDDLIYFVEDDYLHTKEAVTEMLFTYEKISSQMQKEIFLCPADYPYLYSNIESSKIFFGHKRHWRTVKESLITFLTSKEMILQYWDKLVLMGTVRHHPMEKKLHEIFEKEYCLSPIPSLAMHSTNINSAYGIPPNFDWKKVWDENEN